MDPYQIDPMMPQMGAMDPMLALSGAPNPAQMGGMGGFPPTDPGFGAPMGVNGPTEAPRDPFAPATDPTQGILAPQPGQQGPPGGTGDPTLDQMLLLGQQMGPRRAKRELKAPPAPDEGFMQDAILSDRREFGTLTIRMSQDLALYRQHEAAVPKGWKAARHPRYIAQMFSTLVNKFANLLAGLDAVYESHYTDQATEQAAQAVEDFCRECRRYEARSYTLSTGSGSIQRDEFMYLLVHGRIVARVLPDVEDEDYPFAVQLLDPASVFPVWGGPKEGLVRVTREYESRLGQIVGAFGDTPQRRRQIFATLNLTEQTFREQINTRKTVREYWDKWYRGVFVDGLNIVKATKHHLGVVPFVYVTATGEPPGFHTPHGMYPNLVDLSGTSGIQVSYDMDLAEKGVSVFHYLKNTKNLYEALNTLFLIEIEKAQNPAKITYQAPQLFGQEVDPLDQDIGGENFRMLGLQQVEGVPTSPRPTDSAPIVNALQQEMSMGGNVDALMGTNPEGQTSGFALQNRISMALDMVRPYKMAWETFQALKVELKIRYYRDLIAPIAPLMVGHKEGYGQGSYTSAPLTVEVIERVGTMVDVTLSGISPQEYPQQVAATSQAIAAGLLSQRAGMERMEIKNPDKMFSEILVEKAMQHPMMMDLLMIPNALISQGQESMARVWADVVIAPLLMQTSQMGMGMGGPPGAGGPGAPGAPPGGGGVGGQQNLPPDVGQNPSSPGGPAPGQGRGPALQ